MKITYSVYAHTDKESAFDAFDSACREADYTPTEEELSMAKYIGCEIQLRVRFDTDTKKFEEMFIT